MSPAALMRRHLRDATRGEYLIALRAARALIDRRECRFLCAALIRLSPHVSDRVRYVAAHEIRSWIMASMNVGRPGREIGWVTDWLRETHGIALAGRRIERVYRLMWIDHMIAMIETLPLRRGRS